MQPEDVNPPDNKTKVNEGIIRFFEPINPEFDRDFADENRVVSDFEYLTDVRVRFDVGQATPAYATSGRHLCKLKARDGSQVFIRNAQVQILDGNMLQITFNRGEQVTTAQRQRESLWTPEMQKQLTAETEALENKLTMEVMEKVTCPEFVEAIDDLPPEDEDEEEDPVFILWEGGGIEEFKNEDDARDEIMAMESRGCTYMKFSSREEAEAALANMAAAFLKKE